MTRFRYRALAADGRPTTGIMIADDPSDLERRLRPLRLDLISCRPSLAIGYHRRLPRNQLINLCFHLAQFTRSGIPLVDGLRDLRDSLDHGQARTSMALVVSAVENGSTLSAAMADQSTVFDAVVVSLVRAGEETGQLAEVLAKLVDSLKWQDELAAQSKRLLLYPAFMAAVVGTTIVFLLTYLMPRLIPFLSGLGQQLPLHTRMLIWLSAQLAEHWPWLLVGALLVMTALPTWLRLSPGARLSVDGALLRLPLLGTLRRKLILARFADVLAMLYAAGIPLLDALHGIGGVIGNKAIERGIAAAADEIAAGRSISAAFADTGVLPPLVVRMLRIGEQTGALDAALANASYFFGREVKESVARIQVSIEPTMTIAVGSILAWVMLAVLGPVYDAIGSLRF